MPCTVYLCCCFLTLALFYHLAQVVTRTRDVKPPVTRPRGCALSTVKYETQAVLSRKKNTLDYLCVFHPIGSSVVCVHHFGVLHISMALDLSVITALNIRRISWDHTGGGTHPGPFSSFHVAFLPHVPSAVLAFTFIARRVQPPLSLVNDEVDMCVYGLSHGLLTNVYKI